MPYATQKISNHPLLPDVERYVSVFGLFLSDREKTVEFFYSISYMKEGVDISNLFSKTVPRWVITNNYTTRARDVDGNPIMTPGFVEQLEEIEYEDMDGNTTSETIVVNEADRWVRVSAYDYFKALVFDNVSLVPIAQLLESYIPIDDAEVKRFDFIPMAI